MMLFVDVKEDPHKQNLDNAKLSLLHRIV